MGNSGKDCHHSQGLLMYLLGNDADTDDTNLITRTPLHLTGHGSTVVTETHREAAEIIINLNSAQVIAQHAASFSSIAHAVTELIIGSRMIIARRSHVIYKYGRACTCKDCRL